MQRSTEKLLTILSLLNTNQSVSVTAKQLGKTPQSIGKLFKYYGFRLIRKETVKYDMQPLDINRQ